MKKHSLAHERVGIERCRRRKGKERDRLRKSSDSIQPRAEKTLIRDDEILPDPVLGEPEAESSSDLLVSILQEKPFHQRQSQSLPSCPPGSKIIGTESVVRGLE